MEDHSANHLMLANQASKQGTSLADIAKLREFAVDYDQVEVMTRRIQRAFDGNADHLRQALESLVDLFRSEYVTSPEMTFETALMVWRGMLIALQFENLLEWEWNQLLIAILRCMNKSHEVLRKHKETAKLVEYIAQTVSKKHMLNIV